MLKRILAGFSLILASTTGQAQTSIGTDAVTQVQGIAPQLVAFAGSDANFRSLVLGLSQGVPVTLVTLTADGLTQTVTFTPASAQSPTDIARTLEAARQQLISRGIAAPTAQQVGTILAGGDLPTPAGTVPVPQTINTVTAGGLQTSAAAGGNASAGASTRRLGTTNPTPNLNVDIRSTAAPAASTGTATAPTTATGPNPVVTNPNPTFSAPNPTFSAPNPIFTSTPAPAATNPNGAPPAAVQMQGRR